MQSIEELKTYIGLMGNKRIPEYEAEIFANSELTSVYLNVLCSEYSWYSKRDTASMIIVRYAYFVITDRWPEAEVVLLTDPEGAYMYSVNIFGDRWYEAEEIINSDPAYKRAYAQRHGTIT